VSQSPRDASTVVLVRNADHGRGLQVWLMQRLPIMAFAAGAHVFPGGAVDPLDDASLPVTGSSIEAIAGVMGAAPDRARRLVAAAVRETFEECGVVLTSGAGAASWSASDRADLLAGRTSVGALLERGRSSVDLSALVPWAWWLTPDFIPRRYDTWFFLVNLPPEREPVHVDDGEAVAAGWWNVDAALDANRRGEMLLLPPTLLVLTGLSEAGSVDDALATRPHHLEQRSG